MAGNCAFPEMFSREAIIRNNCVHLEIFFFFCHLGIKKELFAFMEKKEKESTVYKERYSISKSVIKIFFKLQKLVTLLVLIEVVFFFFF